MYMYETYAIISFMPFHFSCKILKTYLRSVESQAPGNNNIVFFSKKKHVKNRKDDVLFMPNFNLNTSKGWTLN